MKSFNFLFRFLQNFSRRLETENQEDWQQDALRKQDKYVRVLVLSIAGPATVLKAMVSKCLIAIYQKNMIK